MIGLKKNLDLEIDLSWFNYLTRKGWVSDKFVKFLENIGKKMKK